MNLGVVGLLISAHVAAMFAPSALSGWVSDRAAPRVVILVGLIVLATVAGVGVLTPDHHRASMMLALAILSVDWNFCVVGGTTMLVRAAHESVRLDSEAIGECGVCPCRG